MALGENGESEEVRSLRDDLTANLREIEEREASAPDDEGAKAPEAEANTEAAKPETDRGDGRDAHGRFVKKPEASAEKPQTEEQQQQHVENGEQPPADETQGTHDAPPKSWRADEAQAWKDIPQTARAAILRREQETARLAGANDAERMFGREFAEIVRPHMEVINQFGVSPQFAVRALLENDRLLRSGTPEQKLGKARQLLADYGIDLTALADPNAIPQDPHVLALQREVQSLQARLSQPQGQQFAPLPPTAEESNIMAEIEAFRSDPAHPHFDAVQAQMGKLLETGAAPDLESAYQAAVAMTPTLRSTAAAPQRTQEEKTAAARRASASVTGSQGPTGKPTPMTLRDELAEGLRSAGFPV